MLSFRCFEPSISADPSGDLFHDGFESATTAAWSATEAPVYVEFVSPAAGSLLNDATPDVVLRAWTPTGAGVDTGTLTFTVGGAPRAFDCLFEGELATCTPQEPLTEGGVALTAQVADLLARPSPVATTSFTLDLSDPVITLESPADGLLTSQISVAVVGSLDQDAELTLNFQPVALDKDFHFVHPVPLAEGLNLLTLRAVDAAGNLAIRTLTVTRDTTPPAPVRTPLVAISLDEGMLTITGAAGAVEGNALVRLRNLRTGASHVVTASPGGAFVAELAGELGDVVAIEVEDTVGLRSAETQFEAPYSVLPDPALVAPPLDPTLPYSLHKALEFLYTGPNPTQSGVAPGTIERRRVAWLRGEVRERGGEPLAGVRVSVLDQPEYGSTSTRADGVFDLVVNGGGPLTLSYERVGFLPIQRQVDPGWRETAFATPVVMIRLDPIVTAIQMAAPEAQVALSSEQEDVQGKRSATLVFQAGTMATLVLEDGGTQELPQLHVRATEYTVGEEGPAAMPGRLPAGVGYTYAVELSADEARATGASRVEFSQPVAVYVDNFHGFPAGTEVPAGTYDHAQGLWIGSPDGRVVDLLGIDAEGRATLDVEGLGQPSGEAALAELGITDGERRRLAERYGGRISLWRVQVPHFSPWDFNWPISPPDDAVAPPEWPDLTNDPGLGDDDGIDDDESEEDDSEGETPCGPEDEGSVIDCESMELRQSLELVGTPLRLSYASSRVPGANAGLALRVPVSDGQIPASLRAMTVAVTGMGARVFQGFAPAPWQTALIPMQSTDGFGRSVTGRLRVSSEVTYVYDAIFQRSESVFLTSWARFTGQGILAMGGVGVPFNPRYMSLGRISTQTTDQLLKRTTGYWDNRAQQLGGWSLDVHHVYDPESRTLYRGDGTKVVGRAQQTRLRVFAGTGETGFAGDGGPATQAELEEPSSPALAPDGSLYFADIGNQRIRRVDPEGTIETVVGTGETCTAEGGGGLGEEIPTGGLPCTDDGRPGLETGINLPESLTFGPDGRLYFLDAAQQCVRRYDPRTGLVRRVAGVCQWVDGGGGGGGALTGDGGDRGSNGDGGLARLARIFPDDIAVRRDGTLLIVEGALREVTPDGVIETIQPDGGFTSIAVGPNDELYLGSAGQGKVFRLRPNGPLEDFAGGGDGSEGCARDGQPALGADFCGFLHDLHVGRDGRLHVQAGDRVLRIETDGTLSTVFGPRLPGPPPTGEERGSQRGQRGVLGSMSGFTVGDTGAIWAADPLNQTLWLAAIDAPDFLEGELLLPNRSGSEVYVFDQDGRHLRTRQGLTGATLYEFEYQAGLLSKVTDVDGLVTTIHRDPDGKATAIESPFGQITTLEIDGEGWLRSATNPAKETHSFDYQGGLMTRHTDPRQIEKTYQFAGLGRLRHLENADGGERTYSRIRREGATDFTVTKTSEEGIRESFTLRQARHGETRREILAADQTRTTTIIGRHGDTEINRPDGAVTSTTRAVDPRWHLLAPYDDTAVLTLPSGKELTRSTTRLAPLLDEQDPFSFTHLEQRTTVNGKEHVSRYDPATRRTLQTTPLGRSAAAIFDAKGRATRVEPPGVLPVALTYTNSGKLDTLTSGSGLAQRVVDFRYDARNRLDQVLDPEGRAVTFGYDDANRVTSTTLPDQQTVGFGFDVASNITSVTPPGRPAHTFTYTPSNRLQSYQLPDVGNGPASETRTYDADLRLTFVTRPDGKVVGFEYDEQKYRLSSITSPRGNTDFGYDGKTGQLTSIEEPDGQGLAFEYDGPLVTKTTWSGEVSGTVERAYDEDLRLSELRVNGADPIAYRYDDDGQLIQVGDMTITRDPVTGRELTTTLGQVTTERTYTAFGEPAAYTAKFAGSEIYFESYVYNKLGWIEDLERRVHSASTLYHYEYDARGRLSEVWENGVLTSSYTYDANSNRLTYTGPLGDAVGVYDARDRLIAYGGATYTYTEAGELETKTENGLTTTYDYDVFGNLRKVELPNGIVVEYVIDGAQRRVGEKIDDVLVKRWLYQNQLHPLAQLSADGQIESTFVYGTRLNTPDYLQKNGSLFRIVADQVGSPRLVLDAITGTVAQELRYEEFGRIILDTSPGFQPFGFAGGLLSQTHRSVRFGAREYQAEIGRWTSADPIGFDGESLNLYSYSDSHPITKTDPTGLWDLFVGIEVDFIGLADELEGVEGGVSLVYDSDNWRESGVTISYGSGRGLNLGIGGGIGACIRESEGRGYDVDLNLWNISPQGLFDEEGFNGLAFGGGPGLGASAGTTDTIPLLTIGDIFDFIGSSLDQAGQAIEKAIVGGFSP